MPQVTQHTLLPYNVSCSPSLLSSRMTFTPGIPRYSDRLCSDTHYSDNPQSGRRHRVADCSWIGLQAVPIGKTSNQIPKIRSRGQYNCVGALEVCCNFSGGGGISDLIGIPSPLPRPHSPRPPRCLDQWRAVDACDASTPSNFIPISTIPTYA